jgi:hypothetical protein
MATPIRFAPVLEGNDAIEFYERWYETMNEPDTTYPSKEEVAEIKEFYRKFYAKKYVEQFKI